MHVFVAVGAVGVMAALTLGFAELCSDLVDAARARSAADAAALAGVTGGSARAADVAAANGATIESFSAAGAPDGATTVTITVRVGEATSMARATGG